MPPEKNDSFESFKKAIQDKIKKYLAIKERVAVLENRQKPFMQCNNGRISVVVCFN